MLGRIRMRTMKKILFCTMDGISFVIYKVRCFIHVVIRYINNRLQDIYARSEVRESKKTMVEYLLLL